MVTDAAPGLLPIDGMLRPARVLPPTRRSILRGIMVFRWLTVCWASGVFVYEIYDRNIRIGDKLDVTRPWAGLVLLALVVVFLVALTRAYISEPDSVLAPGWVFGEIALATIFFLLDVWVYGDPNHSQALPTIWPVAAIATVALAAGQRAAVLTGAGFGVARYVGWIPYNETPWNLTRTSSLVLLTMAGWTAAYLFRRLEETDQEISGYRAREEVARTLHDGVLQTLAVIQRRSNDEELVALARRQELDLRDYLFAGSSQSTDLAAELRAAARAAEEMFGLGVNVVLAPDLPAGSPQQISALTGAVREALNNAGKHAGATAVTVYAEPQTDDEGAVFVSIKDDGIGFDPDSIVEGQGLSRSIRDRLVQAGGRTEIDGRPGRGAEIRLWL